MFYYAITLYFKLYYFKIRTVYYTGSPKKHGTWKTTWGLLTDIYKRMKLVLQLKQISKNLGDAD